MTPRLRSRGSACLMRLVVAPGTVAPGTVALGTVTDGALGTVALGTVTGGALGTVVFGAVADGAFGTVAFGAVTDGAFGTVALGAVTGGALGTVVFGAVALRTMNATGNDNAGSNPLLEFLQFKTQVSHVNFTSLLVERWQIDVAIDPTKSPGGGKSRAGFSF
jgi:hypothetical protein